MPRVAEPTDRCRLSAFGVLIDSELALLGAGGEVEQDLAPVLIRRSAASFALDRDAGETVLERHWEDGALGMRVRRLLDEGYVVDAPGHGSFAVSPDGDMVVAHELLGPPERWQRPLFGQVLPIAATLRGYETVHASAVVIGGGAVAISAPSGTGKSSLMMSLVDRGAGLLADDVVALEIRDVHLIAHAGSPLVNLSPKQHAVLSAKTRAGLGDPVAKDDKLTFAVSAIRMSRAPLRAFVELRRSDRIGQLEVTPVRAPSPLQLLSATFLPHVVGRSRSIRQLQTLALLAEKVSVLRLDAPTSVPAHALAERLERAIGRSAED